VCIKNILRKTLFLLAIGTISCTIFACGKVKHEPVKPDKDANKIVIDESYTQEIKKDNGIKTAQVYMQNGEVTVTLIIKDTISDDESKQMANKYGNEVKETYKDNTVNVQAIKKGKVLVDLKK